MLCFLGKALAVPLFLAMPPAAIARFIVAESTTEVSAPLLEPFADGVPVREYSIA